MSQHSLLNIQEISSRTFNNDPSIMQTSIEHFERQNHPNFTKHDLHNMSLKRTVNHSFEDAVKDLKLQNQSLKKQLHFFKTRIIDAQKANGANISQQNLMKQMMQEISNKQSQIQQSKRSYFIAINNLKQTLDKNEILSKEVSRLNKKLKQSQLNYSREQQVYQKSQNLISNLSITKSNYEIELVNMKDSLIILEKENKKVCQTNEQYQEKLALISQQIERLRILNEKIKKQNQMLKFNISDSALKIKQYESESIEMRTTIQKQRTQAINFNAKITSLTQQLRQYYQQLAYKDNTLNDYKEGQGKIQKLIKEKQRYIEQLQGKVLQMDRVFKIKEEQFFKQRNSYSQEIGKLRSKISEEAMSNKEITIKNQNMNKQFEQLAEELTYLKDENNALHEQLNKVQNERDHLIREREDLIQQLDMINKKNNDLNNQTQNLKSDILTWQSKYQSTQSDFKRYEENERKIMNECQAKIDIINQQRASQLNVKASQLNQCKYELANKINQINQIKSEFNSKCIEISRLKDQTTSQSTVFDNSRREFDQKIRQKNQIINDLKNRLSNCEKLIEQNRRERDLIFQQKNSLMLVKQKTEQTIQLKNSELRNSTIKLQELGRSLKEISFNHDKKAQEIENYKRIINDNEIIVNQLNFKIKDSENRVHSLTNELERVAPILRDKQALIINLTNKCKQFENISMEKHQQVTNLKQNNEKMNIALSYAEQSKGNFQIFLKEIERLNQIVLGKEAQIKNLRLQLAKIIQKIDQISQQQLKILKTVEISFENSAQKDVNLNNQFTDLKEYINRINQTTNVNLKDLYQQSNSIMNQLNHNQNGVKLNANKIQQKLDETNRQLVQKQTEIILLKKQIDDLNVKISQYQKNSVQQSQIFSKILELSRENAAVRQQLVQINSQREYEMQDKNKNISHLESQVNQLENAQNKELKELKYYIEQKQKGFQENRLRFNQEISLLKQELNNNELVIKNKDEIITKLENKLMNVSVQIQNKMKDIKKMEKQLLDNVTNLEKSKITKQENYQSNSQTDKYINQISKLQKILELREEQLSKNSQNFQKMQSQLKKYKHASSHANAYKEKYIEYSLQLQQRTLQRQQLEQKLKEAQNMIYYLQQNVQANNHAQSSQQIIKLKKENEALERQLQHFYTKLRENQGKLSMAQEQVSRLIQECSNITDKRNQINKIQKIEILQKQIEELQDKNFHLQTQLEQTTAHLNQHRIENSYLHQNSEQNKIFLHSYEYKSGEVERQYKKLKEVFDNLSKEYSKLQLKNHEFEIELKKAEILHQKIQVLNGELNRLSLENINLNQEISSCKLALGDESTLERRNTQLLTLIVLLMSQVQSLRSRIATQQIQLNNSRILQLGRYKN